MKNTLLEKIEKIRKMAYEIENNFDVNYDIATLFDDIEKNENNENAINEIYEIVENDYNYYKK